MKYLLTPHLRKSTPTVKLMAAVLGFFVGFGAYDLHLSYFHDAAALAGRRFCAAHGALMREERVPVVYGMTAMPVGYDEAREALFLNAPRVFLGGCVRGKQTHSTTWVCDSCRAARLEWLKQKGFLTGESRYGEALDSR